MSVQYVSVSEEEGGEPIDLPTEDDGSLLLSTVGAQFAGASGLKYRTQGRLRGLRATEDRLAAPAGGWGAHRYFCAFPRCASPESPPPPAQRCSDLIVLGLAWRTGEAAVREYFSSLGTLQMVQVKRDARTGLSKGFGFIKFSDPAAQARALARRHMIDGRWCDVRIPNSKCGGEGGAAQRKVFVGRCTEALTADDLRDYFASFGRVTDVFVPKPFRAFSFVTFMEPEVAQSLCGQDHIIKGVSVNISTAAPKRARAPLGWGLVGGGVVDGRLVGGGVVEGRLVPWPPPAPPPAHPLDKPYLNYE